MELNIIGDLCALNGDTLGEVLKNFFLYIAANNDSITSNIEDLLSCFIPENNLQKCFRLYLIDKFQRKLDLIRTFEEDDNFSITRALNCNWFYTDIEYNAIVLVNDVLPNFSYCVRTKILNKYGKYLKDVNKAEEIYIILQQRYGSECAHAILPACSSTFVKDTLLNSFSPIKPGIIIALFRSYPDVIIDFISMMLERNTSGKKPDLTFRFHGYSNIFKLIASKYPERFIEMYNNHNQFFPTLKLGNRIAKRLIKTNPSFIINQWSKLEKIINQKHIKLRYMNISQIEELQYSQLPDTSSAFFHGVFKIHEIAALTSHLKEVKRQEIFLRNYKKRYGKDFNIDDLPKAFVLTFLLLIPTEMRLKWIQSKLPELEDALGMAEHLSYLPPDVALPALKELIINQQDFSYRAYMLKYMLLSSFRYNDHRSLIDCISFTVDRLRNDNVGIRRQVFGQLERMTDLLRKLSIEEWSIIDKLIDLIKMNDETEFFTQSLRTIMPIKIEKYFSEDMPVEELLKEYYNLEMTKNDFKLCIITPYRKKCLEFFISTLPSLLFEKQKQKQEAYSVLFDEICTFNHLNKNDILIIPEWLIEIIENELINDKYSYNSNACMMKLIRKDSHLKDRIYSKIFYSFLKKEILLYILHKKPLSIVERKESLMKTIVNCSNIRNHITFFKRTTLFTFLSLPQILIEQCVNILQAEYTDIKGYNDKSKPNAMSILSVLMPVNDFITIINQYTPINEKLGNYTDENRIEYDIRKAITFGLKHVNSPSEVLTHIKYFAVGDYLKLVVGSLESVFLKIPEKKILPLLIQWMDSPASLKKHMIRSYYRIAPVVDTGKLMVSLLTKEKTTFLRHLLLQYILKYFLKEPCEERFTIFKASYNQLTSDDVAILQNLMHLGSIPNKFIAPFVKMLWELVELTRGPLIAKNKSRIINMLNAEYLNLLPEKFCDILLEHAFSSDCLVSLKPFITIYLVFAFDETSQMSRLEKVSHYIKQMVQQDWNSFNLQRSTIFQTRNDVYYIIESICDQSLHLEDLYIKPINLLEKLKFFLLSLLPAAEIIKQILLLETTGFIINSDINNDANFVHQLANYYEEQLVKYCSTYGEHIILTIVSQLPKCLNKYKLQLTKILLFEHSSHLAHLMALRLMNTNVKDIPTYTMIIEFLLKCNDPFVKSAAAEVLRNLRFTP